MGRYKLKKEEQKVLYLKYRLIGLTSDEANNRIAIFCEHLKNLAKKLKKKKMTDERIKERFKIEFERLCQRIEGMS